MLLIIISLWFNNSLVWFALCSDAIHWILAWDEIWLIRYDYTPELELDRSSQLHDSDRGISLDIDSL